MTHEPLSDAWTETLSTLANGWTVQTICEHVPGVRTFWVVVVKDDDGRPTSQIIYRTGDAADDAHDDAVHAVLAMPGEVTS